MAHSRAPVDPAWQVALENQRRLTVQEYERMVAAGVFDEDERLELLEGVIVAMSPQRPAHSRIIQWLCDPLFARVPPEFVVRCQLPLSLEPRSQPEPDVAVVRRSDVSARDAHPATAALVFEVAGESLDRDRVAKARLYASAAIPDYVIVVVDEQVLEVRRDPHPADGRYRSSATLTDADRFESAAVPGFGFEVRALFD